MTEFAHDCWIKPRITLETNDDGTTRPILEGMRAIVTGGGKGIGRGISSRLAMAGAKVLICGSGNMDMARATRDEITSRGGTAYVLQADLSLPSSPALIVNEAVRLFGGVDILVNNAAYQPNFDINVYTHDEFEKVITVNLYAQLRLISQALPYLKASPAGRIVNIGSIHSKQPTTFDVGYSTSKGGVLMLTREVCCELNNTAITCNCILPGGTKIEFKSGRSDTAIMSKVVRLPRERNDFTRAQQGYPEDTGDLVVYLCSRMGSHLNGCAIRTDGGAIFLQ